MGTVNASYTVSSRLQLSRASRVIRWGGVIAYPTEAVFGFGCDPLQEMAVTRILALKGRAIGKGFILIAANLEQLWPFVSHLPPAYATQIKASWPGPITWLLPARHSLPIWLTGGRASLAVRVTAHPIAAALCQACNMALISTSANYTRQPPTRSALKVRQHFGSGVDYLLPGRCGLQSRPSRIVDGITGVIVRP